MMGYPISRSMSVIFVVGLLSGPGTTTRANHLLSLTITAPARPVKAGTELRMSVTVRNISHQTIKLVSLADSSYEYEIKVRDANGHLAPAAARLRNRDKRLPRYSGSTFARDLQPGASYVDHITVTELYDLTRPGKYTISVARQLNRYEVTVVGRPPKKLPNATITSNSVTVTVVR